MSRLLSGRRQRLEWNSNAQISTCCLRQRKATLNPRIVFLPKKVLQNAKKIVTRAIKYSSPYYSTGTRLRLPLLSSLTPPCQFQPLITTPPPGLITCRLLKKARIEEQFSPEGPLPLPLLIPPKTSFVSLHSWANYNAPLPSLSPSSVPKGRTLFRTPCATST